MSGEFSPLIPLTESTRSPSRTVTPDLGLYDMPEATPAPVRRLVRAGSIGADRPSSPARMDLDDEEQQSASDDDDDDHEAGLPEINAAPKNAFDVMRRAQEKALQKPKGKRKNDFVAEQADESEDEDMFTALRKAADGEEEDDNNSDLDAEVEGLVDDVAVPEEQKEEQDELALAKHKEQLQADEAKVQKRVERIVAGQERRHKRGQDGLLSDSDYEDDEAGFHRKAKVKKARKFDEVLEGLAANPKTLAFAGALTALDGNDGMAASQNRDTQFLDDAPPAEDASSEPEQHDDDDGMSEDDADDNHPGVYQSRSRKVSTPRCTRVHR